MTNSTADILLRNHIFVKVFDCTPLALLEKKLLNKARHSIHLDNALNIVFLNQAFLSDLELFVRVHSLAQIREHSLTRAHETATGVLEEPSDHKGDITKLEVSPILYCLLKDVFGTWFFFL